MAVLHVTKTASGPPPAFFAYRKDFRSPFETMLVERLDGGVFRSCIVDVGEGRADVLVRADIAALIEPTPNLPSACECDVDVVVLDLHAVKELARFRVHGASSILDRGYEAALDDAANEIARKLKALP